MKSATASVIIISFLVAALSGSILPAAQATSPIALKVFSGSLDPGGITDPPLSWELKQDVQQLLFHYVMTGGSEPDDVVYVTIMGTRILWDSLMGEGWAYCDCSLGAGSYGVTVQASPNAGGRLSYTIGFSLVPQPPVDFSGFFPANSVAIGRSSGFGVVFPGAETHQVVLGVTGGEYEFFMDGESKKVVSAQTQLTIDFASGLHVFDLFPSEGDVRWSVQILGSPKLEVTIVGECPTLNPESGQSTCVVGADATPSDGGTPAVKYQWSASGGSFNSTSSQWVKWTAPPGVASFTLTVRASASDYISDTGTLKVTVVPEFPSTVFPFLMAGALAILLITQKPRTRVTAD